MEGLGDDMRGRETLSGTVDGFSNAVKAPFNSA